MSLSSALNNALSGLQASSRGVGTASGNIANAQVEGFAPRRLDLSSQIGGGGVRVTGVARQHDPALAGLLRQAVSDSAGAAPPAAFLESIEKAMGLPSDPDGLIGRLAAFESALVDAADRPDLDYRLGAVASTAEALVDRFGMIEGQIQARRQQADRAIAQDIDKLNNGLQDVARLNAEILKHRESEPMAVALAEQRDRVLADLSEIVPIRVLPRQDGRIALYSAGGQMLLDGVRPVRLDFSPAPAMTAALSVDDGTLSGLSIDGRPVSAGAGGHLAGGSLAAHFTVRDTQGPQLQASIDELAAGLIARFQAQGVDPSQSAGAPALFSDAGSALSGPATPGLAGRLALDPAVSLQGAAEFWRLRDGLGASAPGPVGDPVQLQRWLAALDAPQAATPGGAARSLAAQVAHAAGDLSTMRQRAEETATRADSRQEALRSAMRAEGVDTDTELQQLLKLEKAYAANARVLQVTDDLLRRLMEI